MPLPPWQSPLPRASSTRIVPCLLALIAFVAPGASGRAAADAPRHLDPADLDGLEALARGLGQLPASKLPSELAMGLGALDLGHDGICKDALRGVMGTTPEQRAMAALHAAQSCHAGGIEELGRVITQQGALDASRFVVEAIDKAAPETVFVKNLMPLREEMEPAHFVLFRHLFGELRASLQKDGSPRARAVWSDYEQWLPALAAGFVRLERETHAARAESNSKDGVEPALFVPRDARRRTGPPLVAVVGSKVFVDGAAVVKTAALSKEKEGEDPIAPVVTRLGRLTDDFRTRHGEEAAPRRVVVRADADVAFEVIRKVLEACATAGYVDVDFAVPVHDRALRKARWSGTAGAPLVLALTPDPARVDWEEDPAAQAKKSRPVSPSASSSDCGHGVRAIATDFGAAALTVEKEAIVLGGMSGASTRIDDVGGRPDEAKLARTLLWLRKQHGTSLAVQVDDDVSMRRLLSALNLALAGGFTSVAVVRVAPEEASAVEDKTRGAGSEAGINADLAASSKGSALSMAQPIVQGAGDGNAIGRVLANHLGELRACYDKEAARRPSLAGKIVIDFSIHEAGGVSAAAVRSSTASAPAVEQCFIAALRHWEFPSATGLVLVTSTISLNPLRR